MILGALLRHTYRHSPAGIRFVYVADDPPYMCRWCGHLVVAALLMHYLS